MSSFSENTSDKKAKINDLGGGSYADRCRKAGRGGHKREGRGAPIGDHVQIGAADLVRIVTLQMTMQTVFYDRKYI